MIESKIADQVGNRVWDRIGRLMPNRVDGNLAYEVQEQVLSPDADRVWFQVRNPVEDQLKADIESMYG